MYIWDSFLRFSLSLGVLSEYFRVLPFSVVQNVCVCVCVCACVCKREKERDPVIKFAMSWSTCDASKPRIISYELKIDISINKPAKIFLLSCPKRK